MTRSHAVLISPLLFALFAVAFCVWSALGNDVNFCVTTGCTLYQDFSISGISLWWIGAGAFLILAACALLGQAQIGYILAALFLAGDICLLLLMALTAPCISCLVAAAFFALIYLFFRRAPIVSQRQNSITPIRHSFIIWIWLTLFIVNLGQVARSQMDVWPILDESGEARMRMFFSPSCRYCIDGINVLSGNVNVAFYPIAETDTDVYRLAKMSQFLNEGMSLAEALGQSRDIESGGFMNSLSPEILALRFRLLRNKAHVLATGSQGVPYFEYRGLPPDILARSQAASRQQLISKPDKQDSTIPSPSAPVNTYPPADPLDHTLPLELQDNTQCGGKVPCPPSNL